MSTQIDSDDDAGPKQGHIFCKVCCDVRRAVIILDIIAIVATLFDMFVVIWANNTIEDTVKDDEVKEAIYSLEEDMRGIAILAVISLIITAASLYGAIKFSFIPVALNTIFLPIEYIVSNVIMMSVAEKHPDLEVGAPAWIGSAVSTALVLYAHVMLVFEIRSGIMSVETYRKREAASCCCL